jgi:phosphatidylinositol alpha-1,6-mannosyltransferase
MLADGRGGARRIVLGVFTQLLGPGGIPYAGRQAAAVLAEWSCQMGFECRILSLNDSAGPHHLEFAGISFIIEGFERRKSRLAWTVWSASPRLGLAYLGHCGLAPLGLPLKIHSNTHYVVASYGIEAWQQLERIPRLALRGASAVTAISRFTADKIVEVNSIRNDQVSLIPLGLDPAFELHSRRNGTVPRLPEGKIILTVARLAASERYKGIDDVIRALPSLAREFPDLHYLVVGEGDDRPRLERLATELAVSDRVLFLGACSDAEVAFYHQACDVYVMPSRGEGFGLVYLEAMACGKPVVAAREGAAPEVVADGETGLLVDYGDVSGLAISITRLLGNPDLGRRMGEAGRQRFHGHYTFRHFQDRLADLLMTQISCKRGSAVELVCDR